MKHYICFDAGTQSVKVAVYDEAGAQVAVDVNPTTLNYPHAGWVEMDVHEYFMLAMKGMKKCSEIMRGKGIDTSTVRAVMGDGIICGIAAEGQSRLTSTILTRVHRKMLTHSLLSTSTFGLMRLGILSLCVYSLRYMRDGFSKIHPTPRKSKSLSTMLRISLCTLRD